MVQRYRSRLVRTLNLSLASAYSTTFAFDTGQERAVTMLTSGSRTCVLSVFATWCSSMKESCQVLSVPTWSLEFAGKSKHKLMWINLPFCNNMNCSLVSRCCSMFVSYVSMCVIHVSMRDETVGNGSCQPCQSMKSSPLPLALLLSSSSSSSAFLSSLLYSLFLFFFKHQSLFFAVQPWCDPPWLTGFKAPTN